MATLDELFSQPRDDDHSSPSQVILANGSVADLRQLSHERLLALQWDQEREFARRILATRAGSPARAEITRRTYDTVPRIYAAAAGSGNEPLVMGFDPRYERLVVKLLARQRDQGLPVRLLEIGYGAGVLLQRIAVAGFPVVGIEASRALWDEARRRLGPDAAACVCHGDFLCFEFPIPQRPFSLVYWNDVLEHVAPDEALAYLRRIHDLLIPGGVLVTVTPNWHMRPSDVTSAFCPPRTEAAGVHLKEYTLRDLTRLLRAAGFDRVATPWIVTPWRIVLWGDGMAALKRLLEPALEWMPFCLAKVLCRGLGLSMTIATRSVVRRS